MTRMNREAKIKKEQTCKALENEIQFFSRAEQIEMHLFSFWTAFFLETVQIFGCLPSGMDANAEKSIFLDHF